jgi:UDP-glucose 4-epimerase
LAAQASISKSYLDSCNDLSINGIGTLNVLRCAVQAEVDDFVFASTSAVYADSSNSLRETAKLAEPGTPYGISKRAAEQYVRLFFPKSVVLRLGNVYGPRQVPIGENQLIARMIRHFQTREPFEIFGDGEQKRDFVYVEDVAKAFYAALSARGGTYNIAYGEAVSVGEAAKLMAELWGFQGYEFKHNLGRQDDRRNVCMDISQAMREMRWDPTVSLEEGMQKTIKWWEA